MSQELVPACVLIKEKVQMCHTGRKKIKSISPPPGACLLRAAPLGARPCPDRPCRLQARKAEPPGAGAEAPGRARRGAPAPHTARGGVPARPAPPRAESRPGDEAAAPAPPPGS